MFSEKQFVTIGYEWLKRRPRETDWQCKGYDEIDGRQ
jgi:hypothetical protein